MFVITGATGHIGGGIAERLLAEGKKVKAVARNRSKLARLEKKGAEIAEGNLDDTLFLAKALAGAEGAFFLIPPDLQAQDLAAYQDRIGASIAKAVAESGIKHVIALSSAGADLPSGNGPIAGVHRQEKRLNAIATANVLHLRPAYFMENFMASIPMIKNMGILGSPLKADVRFPMIATRDIAEHAAKRLARKDFPGKGVQELLGARDVSMQEATRILGKAIGKPDLAYVQFPYEDALKGMIGAGLSKSVAEAFVEMNQAFNEGAVKVKRTPESTTPTSIEDFSGEFALAYQS
jgi:uncharacterized protein YbjT (DUF2867 family)